ncbi:MAG: glycosyltransferase family 39 protein [Herminiimonas sp.]|nr:glycosyltransferase family 39 protein [Herminiimonas sp.]
MQRVTRSAPFLWTLALLFSVVWFVMLGARTLVPTDEGRYAEMAREMLATGDWITTRLNGIKYFEKPPLQIWMTALAFKVFGLGEWQARLWTGLCGFAGIVLTGLAGRRVFGPVHGPDTGLAAALVLGSCLFWAAMGHINTLDMGLAGGMTLALCGLLIAQSAPDVRTRLRWMLGCWAGMALAVLSKGLIGLALPGAVLIIYTVVARDWGIWKRLHLLAGLLVFAAITVPWFVLVSLRNPEFPQFFFIHEHFQRFTSKVHHREGPWYYFLPILLGGLLPWLAVFGQSLWAARREAVLPVSAASIDGRGFRPKKLLLVWSIFIFVFFSISSSKLPSYVLPIFPSLALLIAVYLADAPRRAWWLLGASGTLIGAGMLAFLPRMPRLAKDAVDLANYQAALPWVGAAAVMLLAGALPVLWWTWKRDAGLPRLATLAVAISGFAAVQLLMLGAEPHGRTRSGLDLVAQINAELTPAMPLYAVGLYDQTLPFYLRRTMTLVAHADELEFGLQQEPKLWLPTRAAFVERWRTGPKAIAITRPEIFDQLQLQGVPMRVIAHDARRIVITNR